MEYDKNSEVYSKVVRAGKRTYFFDVKSTKGNDLYLTLTESKKTTIDGRESYQKHKLFLYKEDFEKFQDGLSDALNKITELNGSNGNNTSNSEQKADSVKEFSEVSFEDL
ncbi:MAG: PUR family DNA/RNA-binding protein [Crocinitomicaceae bacterium]|nr:PUR family DNA/RNA-binding protein [Crocinitomicaceae bacterium]